MSMGPKSGKYGDLERQLASQYATRLTDPNYAIEVFSNAEDVLYDYMEAMSFANRMTFAVKTLIQPEKPAPGSSPIQHSA